MGYSKYTATRKSQTPANERMPGRSDQIKNNSGGFVWKTNNWSQLDRFLMLGSLGGTYYVSERDLTNQNFDVIDQCIREDGNRVVRRIVEVSDGGQAAKNDSALVVLARCASAGGSNPSPADLMTRRAALDELPKVARIGTHLFQFAHYVDGMRGWGSSLRNAIAKWYNDQPVDKLAYQIIKYQARVAEEGSKNSRWSHRDLLRKSHPQADGSRNTLYKYVTQGWEKLPARISKDLAIVKGFEKARKATSAKEIVALIEEYNLPREAIPTEFLRDPSVWMAMLPDMPLTATIRNLGTMSKAGILGPMSEGEKIVLSKIGDQDYLRKSRVHPLGILVAMNTYASGHGVKGSNSWEVNQRLVDALDNSFYKSFGNVEPTGLNYYLGIDVSSSMTFGDISGMTGITPNIGAAAMALVTANVENNYFVAGFSSKMIDLKISPNMRLDQAMRATQNASFGSTDCAMAIKDAMARKMNVDCFVIYTDNETNTSSRWGGSSSGHPAEVLRDYRAKFNPNAKLIAVGMTANDCSIADPNDCGMLDVAGFSTATPSVISNFAMQKPPQ